MKFKKWRSLRLTVALTLPWVLGYYLDVQVNASSLEYRLVRQEVLLGQKSPTSTSQKRSRRFRFKLPNEGAAGNRSVGAATRASCPNIKNKPLLTALVPGTNIGLTITERPTFWFYVPYQPNPKTPVDFMLTDVQGKQIYKQSFQLMGTPGVIGIALPGNTPALEVEKTYNWNFSFNCNSTNTREIVSVSGRIKRVQPNSQVVSQLQGSTGRDRIIIYAENGFWYDTLTGLIELRRQNPQDEDLKSDWEDLLKSNEVQLPEIARKPIVSCCQSKE